MHYIPNVGSINLSVGMLFGYYSGAEKQVGDNAPPQMSVLLVISKPPPDLYLVL